MKRKLLSVLIIGCFTIFDLFAQNEKVDVFFYETEIEPNFTTGQIKGKVSIDFKINPRIEVITLDAGELQILSIEGENVNSFAKSGKKLAVHLANRTNEKNRITISYEGKPKFGFVLNKDNAECYTVFATSEWMVCNMDPSDRAKLSLKITVPENKECIASGEFTNKTKEGDKTAFTFAQEFESPSYTYGFVAGNFAQFDQKYGEKIIQNFSTKHDRVLLKRIFQNTPDMIKFFEKKSGIPYYQDTYSQILIGQQYQEMSGLSILKESYGEMVLKDSTENNLISHELAHQWWGNMITCKSWNHFWLNEGLATFMSAAYAEHRFGKERYKSDINSYKRVYDNILKNGKDKPLVFKTWDNPSREDRNIVYFKGAYVFHLLREELGEKLFWDCIKNFSQSFWIKPMETKDLQNSFEKTSGMDLKAFFKQWVY